MRIEDARVALRHGQHQVGLAHHAAGGEVVLAAQAHAPSQVVPAQLEVLRAQSPAAGATRRYAPAPGRCRGSSPPRTSGWRRRATTVSHSTSRRCRRISSGSGSRTSIADIERAGGKLPFDIATLRPHDADIDAAAQSWRRVRMRFGSTADSSASRMPDGEALGRAAGIEPVDLAATSPRAPAATGGPARSSGAPAASASWPDRAG